MKVCKAKAQHEQRICKGFQREAQSRQLIRLQNIIERIGVACKIKLGAKVCKIKHWGPMTNESYIIVGICQSILMNLSFHIKNGGPGPPSVNYWRYSYD